MSNASAVRAGKAYVEIFAETGPLARGLKKAGKMLSGWADGLKSVGQQWALAGAAGVGAFLGAAKVWADAGGVLDDMSQRTGASVESLSALKYAAEQSGTSLEAVETGVKKLSLNLAEATSGSEQARKKFGQLGLSFSDLARMAPEEQFVAVAEALSKIQNPGERAAATVELLGKSGTDLIPLMNGGARGVAALVDEAKRLGLVMSSSEATAAAEFGDRLDKAWSVASRSIGRVGAAVAGALAPLFDVLLPLSGWLGEFIDRNKTLVQVGVISAGVVAALGVALAAAGSAISGAVAVGGILAAVLAKLATVVASLSVLFSPLGLAVVAVSAALAGLVDWGKVGQSVISGLGASLGVLWEQTSRTLSAMGQAIAAGDLSAAVGVLWAFLKMEWTKGTTALLDIWYSLTDPMVSAWQTAVFAIAKFGLEAWAGLRIGWSETVNFIANAASAVVTGWVVAWQWAIGMVEKLWIRVQGLFGKKMNVDMELRGVDAKTQAVIDQAHAMHRADSAKRNAAATDFRDKIVSDTYQASRDLATQQAAARDKRAADRDKALADAAAELNEATKKWDEAAASAEKATESITKSRTQTAISAGGALAGNSIVSGTFSPVNSRGLGGGSRVSAFAPVIAKLDEVKNELSGMRKDERERPKL